MNDNAPCSLCHDKGGVDACCYAPFSCPEDMCHNCDEILSRPCPKCGKPLGYKEDSKLEKPDMNDEECLELYDRMQRLAGERLHRERIAIAKKYGLDDDRCPRCGHYLTLEFPRHHPCYCSGCAFSSDLK